MPTVVSVVRRESLREPQSARDTGVAQEVGLNSHSYHDEDTWWDHTWQSGKRYFIFSICGVLLCCFLPLGTKELWYLVLPPPLKGRVKRAEKLGL